jgi:hypothetical protein
MGPKKVPLREALITFEEVKIENASAIELSGYLGGHDLRSSTLTRPGKFVGGGSRLPSCVGQGARSV